MTEDVAGYRVLEKAGEGGFSVVYRAYQERLDRQVALKVLSISSVDDQAMRRFQRECKITGRLSGHPNVVTVLDVGSTRANRPYIAMEYFEHGSLTDRLTREGPLPVPDVLRIGVKMAGALAATHEIDVLHRDVKPQNILVSRYGEPALADFGIARLVDSFDSTHTTAFTPHHAAPEVLEGLPPGVPADLYSLGSTLYQLLAGRPAFRGPQSEGIAALMLRILHDPPPPIPRSDLPPAVFEVIIQAMAKDPAQRFPNAVTFAQRLQAVQAELGLPVTDLAHSGAGFPEPPKPDPRPPAAPGFPELPPAQGPTIPSASANTQPRPDFAEGGFPALPAPPTPAEPWPAAHNGTPPAPPQRLQPELPPAAPSPASAPAPQGLAPATQAAPGRTPAQPAPSATPTYASPSPALGTSPTYASPPSTPGTSPAQTSPPPALGTSPTYASPPPAPGTSPAQTSPAPALGGSPTYVSPSPAPGGGPAGAGQGLVPGGRQDGGGGLGQPGVAGGAGLAGAGGGAGDDGRTALDQGAWGQETTADPVRRGPNGTLEGVVGTRRSRRGLIIVAGAVAGGLLVGTTGIVLLSGGSSGGGAGPTATTTTGSPQAGPTSAAPSPGSTDAQELSQQEIGAARPRSVTASPLRGGTAVRLRWRLLKGNRYPLFITRDDGSTPTTLQYGTTTAVVGGLTPGTRYCFTVAALLTLNPPQYSKAKPVCVGR